MSAHSQRRGISGSRAKYLGIDSSITYIRHSVRQFLFTPQRRLTAVCLWKQSAFAGLGTGVSCKNQHSLSVESIPYENVLIWFYRTMCLSPTPSSRTAPPWATIPFPPQGPQASCRGSWGQGRALTTEHLA